MNCEISPYSTQQAGEGPCQTSWFIATLRLSSGISIALVLRGPHCSSQEEEHHATLHPKLRIPMSKEGTLLTTGDQVAQGSPTALRDMMGGEPASPRVPCPPSYQDLRAAWGRCLGKEGLCRLPPTLPPVRVSHAPAPEDDKHLQVLGVHLSPCPANPTRVSSSSSSVHMAPEALLRVPVPLPPLGGELTASPSTGPSHPRVPS